MKKALTVKPGIVMATEGNKTITYLREGMKGKTLKGLAEKHKQSFDIARQVLKTVTY